MIKIEIKEIMLPEYQVMLANCHNIAIGNVKDIVSGWYITQKLCDKAVNTSHSTIEFPIAIRPKKCVIKLLIDVFLHFLIFLIGVKLKKCVTELFMKILLCQYIAPIDIKVLYADDNLLYFKEDSDDVKFSFKEMGILCVDLNSINFDDSNYNKNEPESLFMSDFWLSIVNLSDVNHFKKINK